MYIYDNYGAYAELRIAADDRNGFRTDQLSEWMRFLDDAVHVRTYAGRVVYRSGDAEIVVRGDFSGIGAWRDPRTTGLQTALTGLRIDSDGEFVSMAFGEYMSVRALMRKSRPEGIILDNFGSVDVYGMSYRGTSHEDVMRSRSGVFDEYATHLDGRAGNDRLLAAGDYDALDGGLGRDVLIGDSLSETLMTGGGGDDVFRILAGDSDVVITDFSQGDDRIDLRRLAEGRWGDGAHFDFIGDDMFGASRRELRAETDIRDDIGMVTRIMMRDAQFDNGTVIVVDLLGYHTLAENDFLL